MLVLVWMTVGASEAARPDPTSKFYVLGLEGNTELVSPDRIEQLQPKSLHNAQGTTIITGEDASNSLVLSNGTALYFSGDTRIDIVTFRQSGFLPERTNLEEEPSISSTEVMVPRGAVAISTPTLSPGSTMVYVTPHGVVSVHGGTIVIEVDAGETRVTVVEGAATVVGDSPKSGNRRIGAGEQVVARHTATGTRLVTQPISTVAANFVNDLAQSSQNARRSVYFETKPLPATPPSATASVEPTGSSDPAEDEEAEPPAAESESDPDAPPQAGDVLEASSPDFAAGAAASPTAFADAGSGQLAIFGQSTATESPPQSLDVLFPVEVTPVTVAETVVSPSRIGP